MTLNNQTYPACRYLPARQLMGLLWLPMRAHTMVSKKELTAVPFLSCLLHRASNLGLTGCFDRLWPYDPRTPGMHVGFTLIYVVSS